MTGSQTRAILKKLRWSDWFCRKVFGAKSHRYKLNKPLTENDIVRFEEKHQFTLPSQYRKFLLNVGDGGAGPNYGLIPMYSSLEHLLDEEGGNFSLKADFPHAEDWNLDSGLGTEISEENLSEYKAFENEYFKNCHINGAIAISDEGCGYINLLVVSGKHRGSIWTDARCSDGGVYRIAGSFNQWYDSWLSNCVKKLKITI